MRKTTQTQWNGRSMCVCVCLCATNVIRIVVVLIAQGQTNTHHRRHRRAQSNLDLVLVEEEFKILGIVATNIYVDWWKMNISQQQQLCISVHQYIYIQCNTDHFDFQLIHDAINRKLIIKICLNVASPISVSACHTIRSFESERAASSWAHYITSGRDRFFFR